MTIFTDRFATLLLVPCLITDPGFTGVQQQTAWKKKTNIACAVTAVSQGEALGPPGEWFNVLVGRRHDETVRQAEEQRCTPNNNNNNTAYGDGRFETRRPRSINDVKRDWLENINQIIGPIINYPSRRPLVGSVSVLRWAAAAQERVADLQKWSHGSRWEKVAVATVIVTIPFVWGTRGWTIAIVGTAFILSAFVGSPVPWDEGLVDKTIDNILDPTVKISTLAYKAAALGRLGQHSNALRFARASLRLLERCEMTNSDSLLFFGDQLRRELALAFEWANDERSANELIDSIRSPYTESEAMAQQALVQAQLGDFAGARRRFDLALATLNGARGTYLGALDVESEYAAVSPELHKAIQSATDGTIDGLIEIARCQYAAGLTDEAAKSSEVVLTFIMDQARRKMSPGVSEEVAVSMGNLLLSLPRNRRVLREIESVAKVFPQMRSDYRWEDGLPEALTRLWTAIGLARARVGDTDGASKAFDEARSESNVWGHCYLIQLQIESGLSEDAYISAAELMQMSEGRKDSEERGEVVATLVALGEFDRAEAIYWSEPVHVFPDQLARAAMIAGNTANAFEYAKLIGESEPDYALLYSQALDKIVRGLIGPLDRLKPGFRSQLWRGGPWLTSIFTLLMTLALLPGFGSRRHFLANSA